MHGFERNCLLNSFLPSLLCPVMKIKICKTLQNVLLTVVFSLTTFSLIYWRRRWHPTLVLLPGKSRGRRSPVGCSPWGRSELDRTELLPFHFSSSCIGEGNGNPLPCSALESPRDVGAWWLPSVGSHRVGHD